MDPLSKPVSRRDLLRGATAGGFALGGIMAFGADLTAAKTRLQTLKIAGARDVPSVCPYCAVGCGTLISVKQDEAGKDRIINIEGNPDSPISEGNLCPKGAASLQLAINPLRSLKVKYRAPFATEWEEKPLDWAMERIAQLVKETRDRTFTETFSTTDKDGKQVQKQVNHTLAIGSLGGATMDNEWNYVQLKLMRALGVVFLENQARI
jgi:formate dehydrogenase major subunit